MSHMLAEAQEAPQRVKEALLRDQGLYEELGARLRKMDPRFVATVARGSSDHAATYAKYLYPLCLGKVVASLPPSVVTVLKAPLQLKDQFVLSISQSGRSPDMIGAIDFIRKGGALTATIVNDTSSPLASTAEVLLAQHAGVEKGLAATKTVICTMTAIARVAAAWSQDKKLQASLEELPLLLEDAVQVGLSSDEHSLQGVSNAFILSRGLGLTAALETALKFKETCGIHAEAFSAAEVRHGPREVVDQKYVVLAFALPGSGQDDVIAAAHELKSQGAKVLLVAPKSAGADFVLPETSDMRVQPIVALQTVYPWLARASRALGRDPDHPKTLKSKVVETY